MQKKAALEMSIIIGIMIFIVLNLSFAIVKNATDLRYTGSLLRGNRVKE